MRVRTTPGATAVLVGLTLVLSGCSSTDEPADSPTTPAPSASEPAESSDTGTLPDGGTPEQPAEVDPVTDLLDWTEQGDPLEASVTAGSTYTLTAQRNGNRVVLAGPNDARFNAPDGFRFSDTLLDEDYAVLVAQDRAETKPSVATIVDLATGDTRTLDGQSDPATVNGGSWALGQGQAFHATTNADGAYCLAEVDLATGAGQTAFCAEPNTGFNQVRRTPQGLSLLSFDNGRPACRSVLAIGEATLEPFPGATECKAWEGMLMPGGAVWAVVPNENQVDVGAVTARVGEDYYALGSSLTGSLVWCAGAAYFSRNQGTDTEAARLMRWDGRSLATVLEAGEGGASSISAPRCGGDAISVSVLAESGDQQLTASLG